ncbi:hypothetical protein [Vibrio breoganii]|uniref:hypothetical protein n=1 Tax=Vibrio breoganii TaxID=553239 RepID=UPI000C8319CC|nr:hypothetical protein [Vibrio breoganii]PMM20308.1 hypothetical protein BCT59_07720 [Vibrio breoganii]
MAILSKSFYKSPKGIKELQTQLGVPADGVWGPQTQTAYDQETRHMKTGADGKTMTSSTTMNDLEEKFGKSHGGAAGAPAVNESSVMGGWLEEHGGGIIKDAGSAILAGLQGGQPQVVGGGNAGSGGAETLGKFLGTVTNVSGNAPAPASGYRNRSNYRRSGQRGGFLS